MGCPPDFHGHILPLRMGHEYNTGLFPLSLLWSVFQAPVLRSCKMQQAPRTDFLFRQEAVPVRMPADNTVEDMIKIFQSFSQDIIIEKVDEQEWGISFQNPEIDPYVYYLEQDAFGLQYHRFTRQAYDALKNSH